MGSIIFIDYKVSHIRPLVVLKNLLFWIFSHWMPESRKKIKINEFVG